MKRTIYQTVINRLKEPRKFIQVLFGPRQVGKTTLMTQVLEEIETPYLFVTADDIAGMDDAWLHTVWNRARVEQSEKKDQDFLLVIDEVQKIQNWSEIVKKEWDADTQSHRPIKVVLLGSSSLLIQKGLSESLAGRFEQMYITHWSYAEMKEAFDFSIDQYIMYGGYPGAASLVGDEQRWRSYVRQSLVETTLSKDILMMTQVNKPILLRRLFDIGSSYSAQILSLNKIQGELNEKGNLTTLGGYLDLLNAAGLLCGLDKYAGSIIYQRASKPKLQVHNNALMSIQSMKTLAEAKADTTYWGRLVESAVGTHLLNYSKTEGYELYYWNENSKEVDFVLKCGEKIVSLEVKSGVDSQNEGIALFQGKFHPSLSLVIGTDGIPFEKFFTMNPLELFKI
ncbi:MAG: ATP-binding protein [Bacteroidales bacterium]|nr:ATP-binding protein [Bacteroidales bacterium]